MSAWDRAAAKKSLDSPWDSNSDIKKSSRRTNVLVDSTGVRNRSSNTSSSNSTLSGNHETGFRSRDDRASYRQSKHGDYKKERDILEQQRQVMKNQDAILGEMADSVTRLKEYGESIGKELEKQNEIIGNLDQSVGVTQGALERGSDKAKVMTKDSGGCIFQ